MTQKEYEKFINDLKKYFYILYPSNNIKIRDCFHAENGLYEIMIEEIINEKTFYYRTYLTLEYIYDVKKEYKFNACLLGLLNSYIMERSEYILLSQ